MLYRYNGERSLNLGAIDIGTNSCRLLISRVNVNTQKRSHLRLRTNFVQWKAIDSFCRIVRLGQDLKKTGNLSEKAIERTLEALHFCYKKICYYRVNYLKIVATEACRKASNTDELIRRARDLYNLSIEVISGEQEAKLALLGCCEILNWDKKYVIVFDIGGGSTEIVLIKINPEHRHNCILNSFYEIIDSISLPYGVVTVNDNLSRYVSQEEIFQEVRKRVIEDLKDFCIKNNLTELCEKGDVQLIGSSGTVTAFAAIHQGLSTYDRRKIDGIQIPIAELKELCGTINEVFLKDKDEEIPCTRKPELMNVGSGILSGIFERIPEKQLTVADRGVREGIIVDLIRSFIIPRFHCIEKRATKEI